MVSGGRGSGTELSNAAREVIYTIRHVIRDEPLDDDLALRHARALLMEPVMGVSPDEEYAALREALGSNVTLSTWHDDPRYERVLSEDEFRSHLRRVLDHLDQMRPWQRPVLRILDLSLWDRYVSPRVVGKINLWVPEVENRIRAHLLPAGLGGLRLRVAVVELRSGREVALAGRWWPEEPDATAVLSRDPEGSPTELMAELTSGSHFDPGEFEVVA